MKYTKSYQDSYVQSFLSECHLTWPDADDIIVDASSILLGYAYRKLLVRREKKKRSVWVKEWLAERGAKGAYNALVKQLMLTDNRHYRQFMRMEADAFQVCNFVKFH